MFPLFLAYIKLNYCCILELAVPLQQEIPRQVREAFGLSWKRRDSWQVNTRQYSRNVAKKSKPFQRSTTLQTYRRLSERIPFWLWPLCLCAAGLFSVRACLALPPSLKRFAASQPSVVTASDRRKADPPQGRALPITRPTALPRTPVPHRQAQQHAQRIKELRQTRADAFAPTPERMLSSQEVKARDETEKQQGIVLAKIIRGNPDRREIALTFDDGPHPTFTPRLLDLLKALNVHATFFLVGKKVDQAPYLVARMVREGHDVGNHTYDHVNLTRIPQGLVENEIRLDNDAIYRACGIEPIFFRPPGGQYDPETVRIAQGLHMTTVFWTDDPADYLSPGESVIEERLLPHIRNGAIILLHDGIEQTWDLLPDLVARLRREGYHFVTLSEMAQHREMISLAH
jgi:peptidoglycan/xylan/chitin deacetylase (PgdA/CDA1 family)